jgi:hypothetical protein
MIFLIQADICKPFREENDGSGVAKSLKIPYI